MNREKALAALILALLAALAILSARERVTPDEDDCRARKARPDCWVLYDELGRRVDAEAAR